MQLTGSARHGSCSPQTHHAATARRDFSALFDRDPLDAAQLVAGRGDKFSCREQELLGGHSGRLGKWQHFFEMPIKRSGYRANCARGLGLLGVAGAKAEPALLQALKDKDAWVRQAAAEALSMIAADKARVAPVLVAGLSSPDRRYRFACLMGLTHCLPGSEEAARVLRHTLHDSDWNKRACAAEVLWRDESDRDETLTALATALKDENATVRDRAAQSIGKLRFDPERSSEALHTALVKELTVGTNEIVVWKILESLAEFGPAARFASPVLKDLSQTDKLAAVLAEIALSRIEPENPKWIEQLVKRVDRGEGGEDLWAAWELGRHGEAARIAIEPLRRLAAGNGDWRHKAMAVTAAWRLNPSSPDPLNLITNNLSRREHGQYEIVRLLGEFGPAARPALPTLLQLRYSRGGMMHDYANDALRNIAPEYLANPWKE